MANHSDRTICWVDCGLFVSFAQKVAPQFGRTLYFTPWANGFPKSNQRLPGMGLEGIERIQYPLDHIDDVDLWVFPDVYFSDLQKHLVSLGKRVWGARSGETLELDRWKTKELLKELGMPVQHCALIKGLDHLREYLQEHEDVWIKVSITRGDFETFHSQNYELSRPRLDALEHELGAKASILEFVVEDAVNDAVEVGYDGWVVDGKYPETSCFGFEIKDLGYLGVVEPYDDLPEPLLWVNEKLSDFFLQHQYRGFFSSECRVGEDQEPYLLDPCCRCGSPPSEVYQELFSNWGDILWNGAEGEVVKPIPTARYACEAMIHSAWADKNWQALQISDEARPFVKLRNHCQIDGVDYAVPQAVGLPEIGAVVGIGETLTEAIEHCHQNAEGVQGYYVQIQMDSIGPAIEEIRKGEKYGIHFPMDEAPDAEELLALRTSND